MKPSHSRTAVVALERASERASVEDLPTSPAREQALRSIMHASPGCDGDSQANRLLRAIRETGFVTTFEGRQLLDVAEVAARVCELRHRRGLPIRLSWVMQPGPTGQLHRIGKYFMGRTELAM